jgi:hypothetical protein
MNFVDGQSISFLFSVKFLYIAIAYHGNTVSQQMCGQYLVIFCHLFYLLNKVNIMSLFWIEECGRGRERRKRMEALID